VPPERFPKIKPELPFGSLPVLDVETRGGTISAAQSNAILRFVGRRAGLYPTDDDVRALKVDEALDLGEDLYHVLTASMAEENAERRMAMRKVLAEGRCRWIGFSRTPARRERAHRFVAGDADRRGSAAPLDRRQAHRHAGRHPDDCSTDSRR
jgi:hypothetical protein